MWSQQQTLSLVVDGGQRVFHRGHHIRLYSRDNDTRCLEPVQRDQFVQGSSLPRYQPSRQGQRPDDVLVVQRGGFIVRHQHCRRVFGTLQQHSDFYVGGLHTVGGNYSQQIDGGLDKRQSAVSFFSMFADLGPVRDQRQQ